MWFPFGTPKSLLEIVQKERKNTALLPLFLAICCNGGGLVVSGHLFVSVKPIAHE